MQFTHSVCAFACFCSCIGDALSTHFRTLIHPFLGFLRMATFSFPASPVFQVFLISTLTFSNSCCFRLVVIVLNCFACLYPWVMLLI